MNKLLLFPFILLLSYFSCKQGKLEISQTVYCDNITSEGECKETTGDKKLYKIVLPGPKENETWENFSNYLYFHSRETPGIILRFNRSLSLTEQELLRKSFKVYYHFNGSRGKVEGVEFGENWVGMFQYLGSIILKKMREQNEEKTVPKIEKVFPAKLSFYYESALFKGKADMSIDMQMKVKKAEP
ncbi:MAG: hypothetical protein H7A25_13905 [Leptospiraceae bacterium]|nr:hypothetical protein [Leptospiraceae bacterium]MCP5500996.1 hypothetical protein [Leptospiraceae bacterium]